MLSKEELERLEADLQMVADTLGRQISDQLKASGAHLHFVLLLSRPLKGLTATAMTSDVMDHRRVAYLMNDAAVGIWMGEGIMKVLHDEKVTEQ